MSAPAEGVAQGRFHGAWAAARLAVIAALGALVYSNILDAPFVLDDNRNIADSPHVRSFDFLTRWSSLHFRYAARITFALNYQLGGLDVTGYHVVNIVIHILAAFSVYWLAALLLKTPLLRAGRADGGGWMGYIPFAAALIFVLHPVQTQAVTYITQRYASLAALFYVLSAALYIKSRLAERGTGRALAYTGALGAAVLAMLSKENAVTVPVSVAVIEWMFFRGAPWSRIKPLLPFLVPMALAPLSIIAFGMSPLKMGDAPHTNMEYLLTQFGVIVRYLRLYFLPMNQNLDYDWPVTGSILDPAAFLNLFILLAVFAFGVFLLLRSRTGDGRLRLAAFGIFWFFITISVESSVIVIDDLIFEHRAYLPSAGFFIGAAALASLGAARLTRALPRARAVPVLAAVAVAAALGAATYARNEVWKDDITLFKDTVRKSPDKSRPRNLLGVAYLNAGRLDEAIDMFLLAIRMKPGSTQPRMNLGLAYIKKGMIDSAIKTYRDLLAIDPDNVMARNNLAGLYVKKGYYGDAEREFRRALAVDPDDMYVHNNLGVLYERQGLWEQAAREFELVVGANPYDGKARYNLGTARLRMGRPAEAAEQLEAAARLIPDDPDVYSNLGYAYAGMGRLEEAVRVLRKALELDPGHRDARENLDEVKGKLGGRG
ncbi:MAG: tetratricopeptide repeat protein [Candidatus Nitrospinota bacterium M3_3B_026]